MWHQVCKHEERHRRSGKEFFRASSLYYVYTITYLPKVLSEYLQALDYIAFVLNWI